jgi:hypothetical protein
MLVLRTGKGETTKTEKNDGKVWNKPRPTEGC